MESKSDRPVSDWTLLVWQVLGFVCLGLLVASMWMYHSAAPQPETFLDRATDATVRTTWDEDRLDWSRQLLTAGFALSALGVAVHSVRRRHHQQRHLALAFAVFLAASVGLWILFR